jgi:hypothetical protein
MMGWRLHLATMAFSLVRAFIYFFLEVTSSLIAYEI